MIKTYSTCDLNLASTLITLGYKLIELDKSNIRKVKFVFRHANNIERSAIDYWEDKIMLPAKTLFANQKTCKNRIYENA